VSTSWSRLLLQGVAEEEAKQKSWKPFESTRQAGVNLKPGVYGLCWDRGRPARNERRARTAGHPVCPSLILPPKILFTRDEINRNRFPQF
jgi:hypothetical protein